MEAVLEEFVHLSVNRQLDFLDRLLRLSQPEVKYNFQHRILEITRYDIVNELPFEITEQILKYLDLRSLLGCRAVSRAWNQKVNQATLVWYPHLLEHCIDINGFAIPRNRSVSRLTTLPAYEDGSDNSSDKNLNVIGARLFDRFVNTTSSTNDDIISTCSSATTTTLGGGYCDAMNFIMGKKILSSLASQAYFQHIVDHDCRGSNVVMAMNEEILAYACEDRHIVVKYADFPHKKICIFEAHQCADLKIYGQYLISGGYDRTICIWEWRTGMLVGAFEGSIKPVYSLDVNKDVIFSSDGKSVISWSLFSCQMLRKTECFEDGRVEELLLIDPESNDCLKSLYTKPLLVTRTGREIKVWSCMDDGSINFRESLTFGTEINHLQPFLKVCKDTIACSCEHGILVWSLIDFSLVRNIKHELCLSCEASRMTARVTSQPLNCRVILLHFTATLHLQYAVHKNIFQLKGTKNNSPVSINWKYPSNEKWPWSHRKPGIAVLVTSLENGVSMDTKIAMFVGTQEKRIYCMFFDASDIDYGFEPNLIP